MIQLNMYLRELSNFLRTLTIKDTLVADQMLDAWVNDDYKHIVSKNIAIHPYYKQLKGEYILFSHKEIYPVIEKLYDDKYLFVNKDDERYVDFSSDQTEEKYNHIKAEVMDKIFPLETVITWSDPNSDATIQRKVPNVQLYRYCNTVPIVFSYDTKTQIPFTKEFLHENNLGIRAHANTAAVYKIPKERYLKLIAKYQKESAIIKAVSYPVKWKDIVNAENFSILSYDDSILDVAEAQSLIDCVADTLTMIRRRYAVEGFCYENLYAPAHYYLVWQILYLALFVQRILNIKTGSVHTYHIWRYLKSHGFEDYRDVMSTLQQKFLYKNLPYINKHKGTQHALEILSYVFLTLRGMSLQAKSLIQAVGTKEETTIDTAKKYPEVRSITVGDQNIRDIRTLKKEPYYGFEKALHYLGDQSGLTRLSDEQEYLSGKKEKIDELYEKERAARLEYQDDYNYEKSTKNCTTLMSYSETSHLNTKLLELRDGIAVYDLITIYTKFIAETLLYLASEHKLEFPVSVQLANSAKLITLPAKNWVGMMLYALHRANCNDMTKYDRPPTYAEIEWPFVLPSERATSLPENFYWNRTKYITKDHLTKIVSKYTATINDTQCVFILTNKNVVNNSVNFIWKADTNNCKYCGATLEGGEVICPKCGNELDFNTNERKIYYLAYNSNRKFWNILDENEDILYHTRKFITFRDNIPAYTWLDNETDQISNVHFVALEKEYVAELLLDPYKNHNTCEAMSSDFDTVETLSSVLHQQGVNFVTMYILANKDESAIHRALYDDLIYEYCVHGVEQEKAESNPFSKAIRTKKIVDLRNALLTDVYGNGTTFEDFLKQDWDSDIVVLKGVLDLYDSAADAPMWYSKMIDIIIETLIPKSEDLMAVGLLTQEDRYKRVVELFKSLTAYNLAYLNPDIANVIDTKLAVHVSDFTKVRLKRKLCENMISIDAKSYHKYKELWKPTYLDQDDVLKCTFTLNDNQETDLAYKQSLLDHIDSTIRIMTLKKATKNKKRERLLSIFEDENLVSAIMNLPIDKIKALGHVRDRIYRHSPDIKFKDIDRTDINAIFTTKFSIDED